MKIQFDSTLQYQLDAICSVVDIFYGQEQCGSTFTVHSPKFLNQQTNISFNETGYCNRLNLNNQKILNNVQKIQLANALKVSSFDDINIENLDFTVEMETGKLEIKNKEDKKLVKINKQVFANLEFKELWDRVKYKTTFSVNFDSNALVDKCVKFINYKLKLQRGKLPIPRQILI